jgi:hypothetical protein
MRAVIHQFSVLLMGRFFLYRAAFITSHLVQKKKATRKKFVANGVV